jgi:hypothetical protein
MLIIPREQSIDIIVSPFQYFAVHLIIVYAIKNGSIQPTTNIWLDILILSNLIGIDKL